jgi:DNA-binding transcriptional LysR family regulator
MAGEKRTDQPLDWENLRFFLELSRVGSLSEAARQLRVDHSTVARRVAALEGEIGFKLFDRAPRGYALTARGAAFVAPAERIEAEVFALSRRAAGEAPDLEGTVRVTTIESFASKIIAPALPAFHERYPGIVIELLSEIRTLSLTRREADLALRIGGPPEGALVARRLGKLAYGVYGSRAYIKQRGGRNSLEPYGEKVIAYDDALSHLPQEKWLAQLLPGRRTVFRANSLNSLIAVTQAGLGLAVLPRFLGDVDPALARLDLSPPPPARDIWMIVHSDLRRSPRVRAVLDFVVATVAKQRKALAGEA